MTTAKKKSKSATRALTIRISPEEARALKKAARAYPDKPTPAEAAHRLLDMELDRDKRG